MENLLFWSILTLCIYRPGPSRGAKTLVGGPGPPGPTLATALDIQLLTRIYNVLVLFILGDESKSECFLRNKFLKYIFSWNFVLVSFVNWTAMVYNWRLTVLSPSSGSRGKTGERPPPEHKVCRGERMRIDWRKNFKFSLNFSKFLLKSSLKLSTIS